MRNLLIASVFGIAALTQMPNPASAATYYPWCAQYSWSSSNCGFRTFEQCMATISGVGGDCRRNPEPAPRAGSRGAYRNEPAPTYYPRTGGPARMVQLPNGRWVSSWSCINDEGYGRYSDCFSGDHR